MNAEENCILLVEDYDDDVFFMERAMSQTGLGFPLQVVNNGQEAIDYLCGADKYCDRSAFPLPCCIFLDLKLPFVTGIEVLEWLSKRPGLSKIPVFVLTSSPEPRDREETERLGARAYLLKPPAPAMLVEVLTRNGVTLAHAAPERRI
jgi:CheY-like chemotaxis protein